MGVDAFQEDVARIALQVAAEHGFALAGENALVAHGLLDRPTEDVDLFSPEPGAAGLVTAAVWKALEDAGYDVEMVRSPESNQGEFARLAVKQGDRRVELDLGRDWRQLAPVSLEIGPVLHLDDAASSTSP